MRRWTSIAAYARREGITNNAARKRAAKYVKIGMRFPWERRKAMKNSRLVLEFRYWDMRFPNHDGSE